ncbi:MAG: GNAT family N-acetyltransferase [Pleurocapsa sp. CRU_1_2]|nr:GNAT family N-acetyltransferase [Pleurocapsa sp. CRU_1_2]
MNVRFATPQEVTLIYEFIHEKAEFDRSIGAYSAKIQTTPEKIQQTIFSNQPFAYVLLAEDNQDKIGFALYGFRYSSFIGQPSIWLDDLFVKPAMRSRGAGVLLMKKLQQIAKQNNCSHLSWTADARNFRGLSFYQRLGAEVVEQIDDRCFLNWGVS